MEYDEDKPENEAIQPQQESLQTPNQRQIIDNAVLAAQATGGGGKIYGQGKPIPMDQLPAYTQSTSNTGMAFPFFNPFQIPYPFNNPFLFRNPDEDGMDTNKFDPNRADKKGRKRMKNKAGSDSEDENEVVEELSSIEKKRLELSKWQRKFYDFFEYPNSFLARMFAHVAYLSILVCSVIHVVEFMPDYYKTPPPSIYFMNAILFSIFFVQFSGRLYATNERKKFFRSALNMLDVFSMIGFIEIFLIPFDTMRAIFMYLKLVRIVRMVRFFSQGAYSSVLQITANALLNSKEALVMLLVYIWIVLFISATTVFFAERGYFDSSVHTWVNPTNYTQASEFQSLTQTLWWAMVTLTTTGYGDYTPVTFFGRICASFTMLAGLTVIALPTSIIGANLSREMDRYQRLQFKLSMRDKRETNSNQVMKGFHESKNERIRLLTNENDHMLQALDEIQELLSEINPTEYYRKYKQSKLKLKNALKELEELKEKNKELTEKLKTHHHSKGGEAPSQPAGTTQKDSAEGTASKQQSLEGKAILTEGSFSQPSNSGRKRRDTTKDLESHYAAVMEKKHDNEQPSVAINVDVDEGSDNEFDHVPQGVTLLTQDDDEEEEALQKKAIEKKKEGKRK